MGRILAPHGVRGWVKIRPFTESVDGLLDYSPWWIGRAGAWEAGVAVEGRAHGEFLVARLEGVADRDAAERFKGLEIAVGREDLPPLAPGEWYWTDLEGLAVRTVGGHDLGRVAQVVATGANDVLVVQGERERLVPIIDSVVREVDIPGGFVIVDWDPDF